MSEAPAPVAPAHAAPDAHDAPAAPTPQLVALRFHGRAAEYFRIWIVNVLLSVLTLGVYSAWAKVRRLRYFYRNTELGGEGFDYHASPLKILAGRAIAVLLLLLYANASVISPRFGGALALALAVGLYPWLFVRARMFHACNTSYRGLRFRFAPAYARAHRVLLGHHALAVLTLGLAYPLFAYHRHALLIENTRFGRTPFRLRGELARYIALHYGFVALFALLIVFWSFAPFALEVLAWSGVLLFSGDVFWFELLIVCIFSFCLVFAYWKAHITNLIVSSTRIGAHALRSFLETRELALLYLTNFLAVVASLGLAIPWAQIRSHRYHVEHSAVLVRGALDDFIAAEREDPEALGEEIGEFFDFGF